MEKENISGNHLVNMSNRKSINISGVRKIESFNEKETKGIIDDIVSILGSSQLE